MLRETDLVTVPKDSSRVSSTILNFGREEDLALQFVEGTFVLLEHERGN